MGSSAVGTRRTRRPGGRGQRVRILGRAGGAGLLLLGCLLPSGCAEEAAALRVGSVPYAAEAVAHLPADARESLADLSALGEAVAREETQALAAPLADREAERARLSVLPLHLAAVEMGLEGEALRDAYREDPEWELRVRHVVRLVPEGAGRQAREEARRAAEQVRESAVAGEDFARLAAQHSQEPGADRSGGLLDWGREGGWVAPFWEAALRLQPGETSPVVETVYGYHVIRLEERRPVPLEEADRSRILATLVPPDRATAAMERWISERAAQPLLDPPVLARARASLGTALADTLVLASWPGGDYTASDLAVDRALLEPGERAGLDASGDLDFGRWVEARARERVWSDAARQMGVHPPRGVRDEALRSRAGALAGTAVAVGFRPGMTGEQIAATALAATAGVGQEERIARMELIGLRPLLRSRYAVSGEAAPPSAAASSSDTRKSESTR